jgi:hypothetical protein
VAYEDALQELYRSPLAQFVAERKRLAGELKAAGDAAAAKQLLERKRPTMSAWVVNQLYWHARDAFDEMLATAEQLRNGHLAASAAHRDAIAKLRKRAATILEDAGHAATEATLRRVTTTLAALSATGGFDPDPPGALAADRDPPGFEAVGIPSTPLEPAPAAKPAHHGKHELDEARATHARRSAEEAEARRREEMAEKRRAEEERKRRRAERHRVEAALRTAEGELVTRERAVDKLEKQLEEARDAVESAKQTIDELREKLAELADD